MPADSGHRIGELADTQAIIVRRRILRSRRWRSTLACTRGAPQGPCSLASLDDIERGTVTGYQWWSHEELVATTVPFYPLSYPASYAVWLPLGQPLAARLVCRARRLSRLRAAV